MIVRRVLFGCLLVASVFVGFQGGLAILEHFEPAGPEQTVIGGNKTEEATATAEPAAPRAETETAEVAAAADRSTDGAPANPTNAPPADASPALPAAAPDKAPLPATDTGRDVANVDAPQASPQPAAPSQVPIEKAIGQMLVMGFQGTSPKQKWPQRVSQQLKAGQIGGVIFLKYNLKNRAQAIQLTRLFAESGAEHPPLLTVDQEGGKVQRLAGNVGLSRIPSAEIVARRRTTTEARRLYAGVARSLRKLGFNTNFGPVVDVNTNRSNPIIGKLGRSYSPSPKRVTTYAREFVKAHRGEGVVTALKHFPGHGSSRKDSHLGFVNISRTWKPKELEPFRRLVKEGLADMVMIGHLFLEQYQDEPGANAPATFSKKLVTDLLRGELGYDGVVISDDMEMGAIRKHYEPREALRRAIKAGNDLLIVTNSAKPDMNMPARIIAWLAEDAAKDAELARRIRESYGRIVALKRKRLAPVGVRQREDTVTLDRERSGYVPAMRPGPATRHAFSLQ